jgi:UDP-glucose 4-epimerase
MILITGGLGFIGAHVTRALIELGEQCVVVGRTATALPTQLAGARDRIVPVAVDIDDRDTVLAIGDRHPITGVIHLAGAFGGSPADGPIELARRETRGLLNVLEAAVRWGVRRVGVASTIGVYGGAPGSSPFREDVPLPMAAGHVIPTFKKADELLAGYVGTATGIEVVTYRIGAVWGPGGRPASAFLAAPQLVHLAVNGTPLPRPAYADDGIDMSYVRDCGRAVALLQVADQLRHSVYNVASGRVTTNGEVAAAIAKTVPDAKLPLAAGRDPDGPPRSTYLDITRLQVDTGFEPRYDTASAVADYVDWLRGGNSR